LLGEGTIGGEVEIGKQDLVFLKILIFSGEGFFDFDNQLAIPSGGGCRYDLGSSLAILLVGKARTCSSTGFDVYLMSSID
jgi:hypothetical protein